MKRMLRKRDVVEQVGLAKSTVADWLVEFQVYIPTVKQGAVTYYLPETIDVLLAIKELREQNYAKPDIMSMLADKGFPITIKEAADDVERVLQKADYRDGFMMMMQTIGETVGKIGEQTERINKQERRLDDQDGRMTEIGKMIEELQTELAATKEELEIMKARKWYHFWKSK